jgi:hypothetical protein
VQRTALPGKRVFISSPSQPCCAAGKVESSCGYLIITCFLRFEKQSWLQTWQARGSTVLLLLPWQITSPQTRQMNLSALQYAGVQFPWQCAAVALLVGVHATSGEVLVPGTNKVPAIRTSHLLPHLTFTHKSALQAGVGSMAWRLVKGVTCDSCQLLTAWATKRSVRGLHGVI